MIDIEKQSSFVHSDWTSRKPMEEFELPAGPESISYIRHKVAVFAHSMSFTPEQLEDIVLAVGEAASNAVRHGSPLGKQNKIRICCENCEEQLVVRLTDEGCGFNPCEVKVTGFCELIEGGRGLSFMRMLMDEVSFSFDRGTTVRLVKHL